MAIPDLLTLPSEADYKQYFVDNYCATSPLFTWDGLPVMFYPDMFEHAFYKRAAKQWRAPKSMVDWDRCKRMPWIKDGSWLTVPLCRVKGTIKRQARTTTAAE